LLSKESSILQAHLGSQARKLSETRFTGRCRSCLDRLLAAAHALTGLPEGRSDWGAFGGPVPPAESPGYAREAQRAVRCLAVMQQLVEGCQVRTGNIININNHLPGSKRA
jgi:hypothetical protein